jgi:hypothetical protein
VCKTDPERAAIVHPDAGFEADTCPIIGGDVHHEAYCLRLWQSSRTIASSQTHYGSITMTMHLINAAALTAVTVFLVNRAFALYDLITAATVSEHV